MLRHQMSDSLIWAVDQDCNCLLANVQSRVRFLDPTIAGELLYCLSGIIIVPLPLRLSLRGFASRDSGS